VVRSILTKRRIQQLPKRPLTASEFVAPLARIDPVFQEEEEALKVSTISSGHGFPLHIEVDSELGDNLRGKRPS